MEVSKELYFQEFGDGPIAAGSEKEKEKEIKTYYCRRKWRRSN